MSRNNTSLAYTAPRAPMGGSRLCRTPAWYGNPPTRPRPASLHLPRRTQAPPAPPSRVLRNPSGNYRSGAECAGASLRRSRRLSESVSSSHLSIECVYALQYMPKDRSSAREGLMANWPITVYLSGHSPTKGNHVDTMDGSPDIALSIGCSS